MLPVIACLVVVLLLSYYIVNRELIDLRSKYATQHDILVKVQNEIQRQLDVLTMCKNTPDKCKNQAAVIAQSATLIPALAIENTACMSLVKSHTEDMKTLNSNVNGETMQQLTTKYYDYVVKISELSKAVDSQKPRILELVK